MFYGSLYHSQPLVSDQSREQDASKDNHLGYVLALSPSIVWLEGAYASWDKLSGKA